ncbi:MAG: carboxypeptidase regulatory-like domain-containing protein [Gammaproteobacteria bacterium]|nr:carboxypeptidase regulatory-like domain-containing protein [Gammaproteobacteria bacterium]
MEFSKTILAGTLAMALIGCGGGDGASNDSPEPETSYRISGTISGLDGSVTVSVNGDSDQPLSANGAFSLSGDYADGTTLSLSLSDQPFTQRCTFDRSSLTINGADISDLVLSCADVGTLSGEVRHYYTGTAVANATLNLYAEVDGDRQIVATTTSNSEGGFTINGTGISGNFQLVASANGYILDHLSLANSDASPAMIASAELQPTDIQGNGEASSPLAVSVDGIEVVSLAANSLVDASGNAYSGPVVVDVGVIDPSADPGLMPGDYRAIANDGDEPRFIESFGALSVVLSGSNGQPLQLSPGSAATIRIPLAGRIVPADAKPSVPLYWFDEARGLWIEEGEATLVNGTEGYYYEGQVSHFTVWNADDYINTVTITGCVHNEGQPVAGAQVMGEGQDYIGRSTTSSDSLGNFSLPVRVSSSVLVNAIQGSQSNTRVVDSPESGTLAIPQCLGLQPAAATVRLSWGESPSDLDSHLLGNVGGAGFELYYGNESVLVGDQLFNLDVDDTTSYGPEVVTMPGLPNGGSFHYVVHRYFGSGTIASSPARVELNLQGRTRVFTPPAGDADEYWHVFSIAVDDNGQAILTEQQQWLSDDGYAQLKVDMGAPLRRTLARQPAYKQR